MAELVDALRSGRSDRKVVEVRVLFWHQQNINNNNKLYPASRASDRSLHRASVDVTGLNGIVAVTAQLTEVACLVERDAILDCAHREMLHCATSTSPQDGMEPR